MLSFLDDRKFAIKINNEISQLKNIKAGVPQGSILGPTLFNIFVRDIPSPIKTFTAMYADDTAVIGQNHDLQTAILELQAGINIICHWMNRWNINLNPNKCECKIFTLKRIKEHNNIKINNNSISWNPKDKTVKYLGLHLDTRLTWSSHVNLKLQQAYSRLQQLYPLLNRKSKLRPKCAILLYKSLLRPLIMYACEIWGYTSKTNIAKIQAFQNKTLRIAVNAPWFVRNQQLHQELSVPTVEEFIKKLTKRHVFSARNNKSAVYYQIGQRNIHTRLKRTLPQDLYLSDSDD